MRLAKGFVLACAFVASGAWAADVTGKWTATAVGNNVTVTLDFAIAGNVVTGAVLNPQSGPAEIRDGKIEGNSISFHVLRTANNATTKSPVARDDRGRRDPLHAQRRRCAGTGDASHREASAIAAELVL